MNEINFEGLDNVKTVSILKNTSEIVKIKIKRYLSGYLFEELNKTSKYL